MTLFSDRICERLFMRVRSNNGTRSSLLGNTYEIAVIATKHVSAMISGGERKNLVSLYYTISVYCTTSSYVLKARFIEAQQKNVIKDTEPSMLSQIASNNFAP